MRRLFQKLSYLLCVLFVLTMVGTGHAQVLKKSRQEEAILGRLFGMSGAMDAQTWLDRASEQYKSLPLSWYYPAIRQSGEAYDYTAFGDFYEAYVKEAGDNMAAASWLNAQLFLYSLGRELPDRETVLSHISERSIMSLIYGLHLSNNTGEEYVRIDSVLSLQCPDGGFGFGGENGDVDVTAMMLAALAPHQKDALVSAAVERALTFLSNRQLTDGGFFTAGSYNSESISVVIIALSSLGIDCETDSRFQKGEGLLGALLHFYSEEGGFRHTSDGNVNELATAEGLCALVAMRRNASGQKSLYLMDPLPKEPSHEEGPTSDVEKPTPGADRPTEGPMEKPAEESNTVAKTPALSGYKLYASVGIILAGALLLIVLALRKRLRRGNVLTIFILMAAALAFVLLTNFESVDKHYSTDKSPVDFVGEVTLSIRCDTVAGKKGAPKEEYMLSVGTYRIGSETTVFEVLSEACRQNRIALSYTSVGGIYIKGIGELYEFDFGDLSGWMYAVNGTFPSVGAGDYRLSPGDSIEFRYTCSLGNDLQ